MESFFDIMKEVEGEEKEEEEYKEAGFAEHTVFLIDASPMSLEPCTISDKELAGLTWLEAAIKVVATTMRSKVIAGGSDELAVVLYNTGNFKTGSAGLDGFYVLQNLDSPSAARISELEEFSLEEFHENIQSGSNDNRLLYLDSALMHAGTLLPGIASGKGRSTTGPQFVMVCTRDPTPAESIADAPSLLTHVGAIASKGGVLQMMPLVDPETEAFVLKPFWQPLLDKAAPQVIVQPWEDEASVSAAQSYSDEVQRIFSIENLAMVVRMRAYRKRAATRMVWSLGPGGPSIGIKLYSTLQKSWPGARGTASHVHQQDSSAMVRSTVLIDPNTGTVSPISPAAAAAAAEDPSLAAMYTSTEVPRLYYPKEDPKNVPRLPRVLTTAEEVKEVKYPLAKGLTLLGFKPLTWLQPYHQLRPATFIYPDEVSVKGSTVTFQSLLEAMLPDDEDSEPQLAICVLVRGPSSEPRLVAAVPQSEQFYDPGTGDGSPSDIRVQVTPPGFHLVYLPFMDDSRIAERDINFTGASRFVPTEEQITAAEEMINVLSLQEDFDPTAIPNPHLQRHFKVLEAAALQEPPEDEIEDVTLPDEEAFTNAAPYIQAFKDITGLADLGNPKKRKAASTSAVPSDELKKIVEGLNIPKRAAEGTLKQLTIPQLKMYLTLHELKVAGKKDELIARIELHLSQQKK